MEQPRPNEPLARKILSEGLLAGQDLVEKTPTRFGRYEIKKPLGHGATGQVFLAHDPTLGRDVALKVLRGGWTSAERFRREASVLAALRHPNVVTIYDAGEQDGRLYYTMDYLGERTFGDARPALEDGVRILEKVALGCHAAHEKGVVHRDLKPANILLGAEPVVVDFGLAATQGSDITQSGQVLGTPATMSPEQAQGREVDARSDVYSLGAMLYWVLCGEFPFRGKDVVDLVLQIATAPPRPPRQLDPRAPADLEAVALKAMAKRPEERYLTAKAFADELRAYQEGRPVESLPPPTWKQMARRRGLLAGASLAAIAVLLAWALWPEHRQQGPPAPNETPTEVIQREARRVQEWESSLRADPASAPPTTIEASVKALDAALTDPTLSRDVRFTGLSASARARILLGRTDQALHDLDAAIEAGRGGRIGDELLARARIRWEDTLVVWVLQGKAEARPLLEAILDDVREAAEAGSRDAWTGRLVEVYLEVVESAKKKEVQEASQGFASLREAPGAHPEEVLKSLGDLALLGGRVESAQQQYEEAFAMRPGFIQAKLGLALACVAKSRGTADLRRSQRHAMDAMVMNPRYPGSYRVIAGLCRVMLSTDLRASGLGLDLMEAYMAAVRQSADAYADVAAVQLALGGVCALQARIDGAARKDPSAAREQARAALERAARLDSTLSNEANALLEELK